MTDQPAVSGGRHIPVLIHEIVELLAPAPGQIYVDCTAGLGGHASAIARKLAPGGTVVLNDVDPGNLVKAEAAVRTSSPEITVVSVQGNFADLPRKLAERKMVADMVLADLGFASTQVDDPGRGLSFSRDGPLDMRLDLTLPVTAAELVGTLPEEELAQLIRMYGEEREAGRIARKLVRERERSPITTTGRLAEAVRSALPRRFDPSAIDPATRTFQALRIAVNDEIGTLEALLAAVERAAKANARGEQAWLRSGGRVAIVGFHSLEDRPVKRVFGGLAAVGMVELLTDGPLGPSEEEARSNPRSRSSRLRAVKLVTPGGPAV